MRALITAPEKHNPFTPCTGSPFLPAHLSYCACSEQDKQRDSVSIPASPHLALVIIEPGAWSHGWSPRPPASLPRNKSRLCLRLPGEKEVKRRGITTAYPPSLCQHWILRGRHTVACVPAIQSSFPRRTSSSVSLYQGPAAWERLPSSRAQYGTPAVCCGHGRKVFPFYFHL